MPKGVGEVTQVSAGGKSGFGVVISDDSGKPVATFVYASKEIADKAKERLTKMVERTAFITAA